MSSSESDGERSRLQEALWDVPLRHESSLKKPSKRTVRNDLEGATTQHVSKEMQTFLAKKLTDFLDSQYTIVDCEPPDEKGPPSCDQSPSCSTSSSIKLLHSSHHPISLAQLDEVNNGAAAPHRTKRKRRPTPSDSGSEESETERCRLKAAAVDPLTIIGNR